ncbi:MAG: hypothetical protein ABW136_03850 [Steroidobacteraceae bacterium]
MTATALATACIALLGALALLPAGGSRDLRGAGCAVLAGVVTVTIFLLLSPPPATLVAGVLGIACLLVVWREPAPWMALVAAGGSAGASALLWADAGAPLVLSAALPLAVLVAGLALHRRLPRHSVSRSREESLPGLGIAALLLAVVPSIDEGWRAAAALNQEIGATQDIAIAGWIRVLVALALVGGIAHGLWKRR